MASLPVTRCVIIVSMNITIFGTGYVGLVTGVCIAEIGNEVICVDVDKEKIERLKKGIIPIYEPGLEELLKKNSTKLEFTTNGPLAIEKSEIIFIAVGTPSNPDGSANLKYVREVAEEIGKNIKSNKIIVIKSTVPVGTEEIVSEIIKKHYNGSFTIVSNPEFLREGSAIKDFMNPDRIVIGTGDLSAFEKVSEIYKSLNANILHTDIRSAEIIKYASNAYLATKISFINEMANLADKFGANIEYIAKGMGSDKRIGFAFLNAGLGYGGSCFPKDVKELIHTAHIAGMDMKILEAVDETNTKQKLIPITKLKNKINLNEATVAILGLAFKPDTDDLREASSLAIIDALLYEGAKLKAWDPVAATACKKIYPEIEYAGSPEEACKDADAAVIVTEWDQLKELDLFKLKKVMKNPLIIDGRNVFDKRQAKDAGIEYYGIGR